MRNRTGSNRYPIYTRWTMAKCRNFCDAIAEGMPIRNAAGFAGLPYRAVIAYLQQGERDATAYYLSEDGSGVRPTLAGQFYLDAQEAIGKHVHKELTQDDGRSWNEVVAALKKGDPDAWQIANATAHKITNEVIIAPLPSGTGEAVILAPPGVHYVEHVLTEKAWKQRLLPEASPEGEAAAEPVALTLIEEAEEETEEAPEARRA